MINLIKSIILGIIQGLAEFLPISSSGHLVLAGHFLGFEKPDISFDIILHVGSLVAVIIYFRKDIWQLMKSVIFFKNVEYKKDRKTVLFLLIATFVTAVIGFSFEDFFEQLFNKPIFSAIFIFFTGIILIVSDYINLDKLNQNEIGIWRSIVIGLGQSFAILPGISRSGSTIATAIGTGVKRSEAARFSFILSIPAILGAVVLKFDNILNLEKEAIASYSLGAFAAFISGYLVISILLKLIKNKKLKYFSFYCWTISIVSIILLLMGY